ncbi:hypothetical protein [Stratiformator vulcanicus]|uniref:Uncharacterized protein n=1 Tax=Stratiformator vulcanicus TaxID=2527980 RepID=A0A517QZC9_9PLAN|nr:hypothetical protein [Stratiformator vulcanicus]QDT36999.1 hypothetical protein Pan189_13640 [Stratiformator vulcanicus]
MWPLIYIIGFLCVVLVVVKVIEWVWLHFAGMGSDAIGRGGAILPRRRGLCERCRGRGFEHLTGDPEKVCEWCDGTGCDPRGPGDDADIDH